MRELLFKGKRFFNGKWIEDNVQSIYDIDDETISQFTGRYDNDLNKIFENDIVEEAGGHRSVVKYSEEEAKFVLESKYVVTELGNKQVTVIGNIFEDPHLIPDD